MHLQQRFRDLLVRAAAELYEDHPDRMERPDLIPTPNTIDDADLVLFFEGLESGLIRLERGGKFNTLDRPTPSGRWSLLSRSRDGGWYNAEYLPQLAAYIELVRRLGYPPGRVLFELPQRSLQLDLAVLSDEGTVVVLGEAKRAAGMLDPFDRCRPRSVQPASATVPVNSFSKATWSGDSDNGDRSLSGNTRAASTSDLRELVAIPILTPRSRSTASSLAISNR